MNTEKNQISAASDMKFDHKITKKAYLLILVLAILILIAVGVRYINSLSQNQNNTVPLTNTNNIFKNQDYSGKLYLTPSQGTLHVGETIKVSIMLQASGRSLDGADVILDFDPLMFDVVSDTPGKISGGDAFPSYPKNRVDSQTGKIYLTGITLESKPVPNTSDKLFGSLTLKAKKIGVGKLSFEWTKVNKRLSTIVENGTSNNILGSVIDGEYQIAP